MSPQAKLRIYTDGSCGFCLWSRNLVEPHDRDHRLDFRDFNRPEIAAETPFPASELTRRMHVQLPDGTWRGGFWGWIAIFDVLPRFRWLGSVLRWPPFRWLGPGIYDLLARNRYRIPQFLLRLLGAPQPCDESCSISARSREL